MRAHKVLQEEMSLGQIRFENASHSLPVLEVHSPHSQVKGSRSPQYADMLTSV